MPDLSRDEFHEAVRNIRSDIAGVNARLDIQNGRVRRNETNIAVLTDRGSRQMIGAGGLGAGASVVLVMAWEWVKSRL